MSETKTALVPSTGLSDVLEVGRILAASGFFPDIKSISQAAAKILAGQEVGLGPIASLKAVYIVNGVPSYSANTIAAAIKRHPRYDYKVRHLDDERCSVEFFADGQAVGVSDFTMQDAATANLKEGNWKKFPRNMLFSRALTNGARWYCPDALGGQAAYTPDELGAGVNLAPGEIIDGQARELDEPADAPFDAPPEEIRPDQIKAIHAIASAIGWITRDDDTPYRDALLANFDVVSSKDLTAAQAASFIELLVRTQEDMITPAAPAPPPAAPPDRAPVTSSGDPLWQRWQAVCAEAVAVGVDPQLIPDLTLPVAQDRLITAGKTLAAAVAAEKAAAAQQRLGAQLRARAKEIGMTDLQLGGLIAHHFGEGTGLEHLDEQQVAELLRLLVTGEIPEGTPQELPL